MLGENNYTCVIENIFGSSNQSAYFVVVVGKLSLKNNKEHWFNNLLFHLLEFLNIFVSI